MAGGRANYWLLVAGYWLLVANRFFFDDRKQIQDLSCVSNIKGVLFQNAFRVFERLRSPF